MINNLLVSITSAVLGFIFDLLLGGITNLVTDIFDGPDGPIG
jgi:hypothetical protein